MTESGFWGSNLYQGGQARPEGSATLSASASRLGPSGGLLHAATGTANSVPQAAYI